MQSKRTDHLASPYSGTMSNSLAHSAATVWQERNEFSSEAADVSCLDPHVALACEVHHKTFATDEERLHAANLVDGVLNASVECDHVAGVDGDGLSGLNWDLLDGTKGVVPHTALTFCAGCLNEEH